jgi:hypothetical protein
MKVLSFLLLLSSLSFGMEFNLIPSHCAPGVGQIDVLHNQSGFFVVKDGYVDMVASHNVDPQLRAMNIDKMKAFAKMGIIKVSQNDKQEYILRHAGQIKGGGFITGMIAGAVVRAVGYGVFGYSVIQTGGETVLHSVEVVEAVEATATGAQVLGTAILWLP